MNDMDPLYHSKSSVKKWGGKVNDYIDIHQKMDCSKAYFPDNRHRCLTHTMFWVKEVMEPIFGIFITNSDGKEVSVKNICERHILEDYRMKFIPTPQDFIQNMDYHRWMQNGDGFPPSATMLNPVKHSDEEISDLSEKEVETLMDNTVEENMEELKIDRKKNNDTKVIISKENYFD